MKRLLILIISCLMSLTMNAQRCAVLDFQIGTGVTEEEIDGLTYNFRSNFRVEGYTMLERIRINRTIETLGFNRTDMTMQQTLKVGRELEAKLVVVGTMNKFMDEYSVDIRAIDVATGVTCATEGATFDKSNYRTSMEDLAARLGKKLSGNATFSSTSGTTTLQKKVPQGYTDLGLPSGTMWKDNNENGHYTYSQALNRFGNSVPTSQQIKELGTVCSWVWTGGGYKVIGPNGNYIFFPASGAINCSGDLHYVGVCGYYWSSTSNGYEDATYLYFDSGKVYRNQDHRCNSGSVRLVQNP